MKCEVRYIKQKVKEDYKTVSIKGMLIVALISFVVAFALSFFLADFIIYTLLMLFLTIGLYAVWKDAVKYCRNRNDTHERGTETL